MELHHAYFFFCNSRIDLECTLLVLINFCPVYGDLLTWSSVAKTLDVLSEMTMEYQI
jgi:hypothetical protein